jgi:RimJ/RimL family protein N-acetyltransferase
MLPDICLETPRLLLRPPRPDDFDAFAAAMADPVGMRYLGGVQPRSTAWRSFAAMAGGWVLLGFGMFSVIEKTSGRWVGRVGPIHPEGWPGPEVGWAVTTDMQGKGIAFEAAVACMDFVFDELGWCEAIHCIEDVNLRSIALAKRLGSEALRLAQLPPPHENVEVRVWGQTREAWRARRQCPP